MIKCNLFVAPIMAVALTSVGFAVFTDYTTRRAIMG